MSITNIGLDALEAIANAGTIASASKEIGVTQTALTQRIKALESELGCSLFVRSRKGMKLTPNGEILNLYAKERSQKERLVLRKLNGAESAEPIRLKISGPTLQTQRRVFNKLEPLKKKHPELYFEFDIDDSDDLFSKIKQGSADFIITSQRPPASLRYKKLESSEFILVGPYSWKKTPLKGNLEAGSVIDFNPHDKYTYNFLKHFKLLPKSLKERHFVNNTNQMIMLVERGLGYAVFDILDVKELIKQKTVCNLAPDYTLKVHWFLCWNNYGHERNEIISSFIEAIE